MVNTDYRLANRAVGLEQKPERRELPLSLRTYLVEDSRIIRANLTEALEELAGVDIIGWADGAPAASLWLSRHGGEWDLAVVDLFLAEGTGLSVLAACKVRKTSQRVVVVSNFATPDMRARCTQFGADAVFDKSTEIDGLIDYCSALHAEH